MLNYFAMDRKILLIYITHVSGHHSATLAIETAIDMFRPHPEVLNINGFGYSHPIMEKVVHAIYMSVIKRAPRIWDSIYDNPVFASKVSNIKEIIHKRSRHKIKKLVESENCKVVICSQAFPCGLVADYKKHSQTDIKLIAVVTDFVPHSYWIYDEIDFYIVGSCQAKENLLKKGISEEKIKLYGIPIDPKFSKELDKNAVADELKISLDKPVVLIMGGGHGLGPIKQFIKELDKLKFNVRILVVAGINKRLLNYLRNIRSKHNVHVFGYIDYIDKLMTIANLLVTKPGGVTTAEALAKGLPMLIINPLPGQEQNNTNFLLSQGVVQKANNAKGAVDGLNFLLNNEEVLEEIKEKIKKISMPSSSIKIAELALELC